MRITKVAAILLGLALALVWAPQSGRAEQGVTADEILVGAFGPITGPLGYIGTGARSGLELAISEINEHGGVNGRKLKLVFEASGSDPAQFLAAAKKLVESDKVFVLMIASGSVGAAAASDLIRQSGIVAYNLIAATPKIHQPLSPNIFHGTSGPAEVYAQGTIDQLLALDPKPKKVAMLVESISYHKAVADGLKPLLEKAGLELVATEEFGASDRDFTGQLLAIKGAAPDAILIEGDAPPSGFIIKQAVESLGITGARWIVATSAITEEFPAIGGSAVEGAKSTWLFRQYHGEQNGDMPKFETSWRKLNPDAPSGRPNYMDLAAYNGMYITALALKNAGDDLTWAGLERSFESLTEAVPSKFGPWAADLQAGETFGPNDHQGNDRFFEVVVKDGHWTVDPQAVFLWAKDAQ